MTHMDRITHGCIAALDGSWTPLLSVSACWTHNLQGRIGPRVPFAANKRPVTLPHTIPIVDVLCDYLAYT